MSDVDLVNPLVNRWLEESRESPEHFWSKAAAKLHWFRPWERAI